MYRVPPSHTLDPRLRRAIAVAVALCSLGTGLLARLMSDIWLPNRGPIMFGLYFALLAACWYAGTKGWAIVLYALAALGAAIAIACVAIWTTPSFAFTPRTSWEWGKLLLPGAFMIGAPAYVKRFWGSAGTRQPRLNKPL
jgi:hypothetical protein